MTKFEVTFFTTENKNKKWHVYVYTDTQYSGANPLPATSNFCRMFTREVWDYLFSLNVSGYRGKQISRKISRVLNHISKLQC
jgi:hypothetical protein